MNDTNNEIVVYYTGDDPHLCDFTYFISMDYGWDGVFVDDDITTRRYPIDGRHYWEIENNHVEGTREGHRVRKTNVTEKSPHSKPACVLTGTDGNVFALAGRVRECLKAAGQVDKADEFTERLFQCQSYDEALRLMAEYVEVE